MEDYNEIETMIGQCKQERTDRLKVREEIRAQMPDVFKGKVFCADCGRQMNYGRGSHHKGYKDITFQYYRCRYSKQFAKCSNKKVQQSFLKIVVMDQIRVLIRAFCDRAKLLEDVKGMARRGVVLSAIMKLKQRIKENGAVFAAISLPEGGFDSGFYDKDSCSLNCYDDNYKKDYLVIKTL